jgi:hypothetical protein
VSTVTTLMICSAVCALMMVACCSMRPAGCHREGGRVGKVTKGVSRRSEGLPLLFTGQLVDVPPGPLARG